MNRELPVAARLGGYLATLALTFAVAYGVGQAVGPHDTDETPVPPGTTHTTDEHGDEH